MTAESPAETIRRAAKLMRERAEAATPGPWWSDQGEDCWRLFAETGPGMHPLQLIKAPKRGTVYAEYWPDAADNAWITSFSPEDGVRLADWLDSAASLIEAHVFPGDDEVIVRYPLAFAREYLREPS
jgi:hypothetical protein